MAGEAAQCYRLLDGHGPVMHLNPSPSLETVQLVGNRAAQR
jgi:hypothetical protein